jgi:hypothetical protein
VVLQTNSIGLRDSLNPNRKNRFAVNANGGLELVHRDQPENLPFRNLILSSGLLTYSAFRWNRVNEAVQAREGNSRGDDPIEQIIPEIKLLFAAYPNSKIILLVLPYVPNIADNQLLWTDPEEEALLQTLAAMDNLVVVYPAKEFQNLYARQSIFPRGFNNTLPNFGHLNRYGHTAVAEALVNALAPLLK